MAFGFLIYPGVEELDFQGPFEVVGMWHKYAGGPPPRLLARSMDAVPCAHGMRVLPDADLAGAGPLQQLLVPGGYAAFDEMQRPDLVGFVKAQAEAGVELLSVCSGSFILQAAGVLNGRRACTNWKVMDRLRATGVDVVEERYVRDGPVWTAAGVSAGIDMLLAYIAVQAGEEVASKVQLHAEYFPDARVWGSARTEHAVPAYVARL